MATIRDGIKIGLGLLLFKWLFGIFAIVLIGGFVLCSMVNEEANKKIAAAQSNRDPPKRTKQKRSGKSTSVVYPRGCVIRRGPSIKQPKVGYAKAGTKLTVVERHGRWRQITNENQIGWCGCRPK
jgi:hypothetical protein